MSCQELQPKSCQSDVILQPSQLQQLKAHYADFVLKWPKGYDFCDVCLMKEGLEEDELIICDLCDGLVHQSCYGGELLDNIPENAWFCGRCSVLINDFLKKDGLLHSKGDKSFQCVLCPEQKGVMKSLFWKNKNAYQWAHMGCVISIKCLVFEDNLRTRVLKKYEPKRKSDECSICQRKMGQCGVCHKTGCLFSFHFSCGKRAGIIQDITLMNTLIECREKRYNRQEPEHHIVFCEEHLYELCYLEYPDDKFLKSYIKGMYAQRQVFDKEKNNLTTLLLDYPTCKGISYSKKQLEETYSSLAKKKQKMLWDQKKQQAAVAGTNTAASTGDQNIDINSEKSSIKKESQIEFEEKAIVQTEQEMYKEDEQDQSSQQPKGIIAENQSNKKNGEDSNKIIEKVVEQSQQQQTERRSRRQLENSQRLQAQSAAIENKKEKVIVTQKKEMISKKEQLQSQQQQQAKKSVEIQKKEEILVIEVEEKQITKKDSKEQDTQNIAVKQQGSSVSKENLKAEGKKSKQSKIVKDKYKKQPNKYQKKKSLNDQIENDGKVDSADMKLTDERSNVSQQEENIKNSNNDFREEIEYSNSMDHQNISDFSCSILDIDEIIRNGLDLRQWDTTQDINNDVESSLKVEEIHQQVVEKTKQIEEKEEEEEKQIRKISEETKIEQSKPKKKAQVSPNVEAQNAEKQQIVYKDMFLLHPDLRESLQLIGPFTQSRWKNEVSHFFVRKNCLNPISREILIDKCTDKRVQEVFSQNGLPVKIKTLYFFKFFKTHFLIKAKNNEAYDQSDARS